MGQAQWAVLCGSPGVLFLHPVVSCMHARSVEHGAIRELKEETDLTCLEEDLVYLGEPKPQKYYFLALKWSGDVNVSLPNPESGEIEHDAYQWATLEVVKQLDNTEIPDYLLEKALEMLKNAK